MLPLRELQRDEFLTLTEKMGIDPGCSIDSRTELSYALAHDRCGECTAKDKCRAVLARSETPLYSVAVFCPNTEVLVDLLFRQTTACG
jgi:hypothetical protein